jgi:hypothetical protein
MWCLGAPGVGKSKLIEWLALQDILAGRGVAVLDPHGDVHRNLRYYLAGLMDRFPGLAERIVILEPTQAEWVVSINPLEAIRGVSPDRLALFLTDVVVHIWNLDPTSTPRMVWLLTNSFLALAELKLALPDLPRFLQDTAWREGLLTQVRHESVRRFFAYEFPKSESGIHQWVTPVLNKIGGLVFDEDIRLMLKGKPTFTFREVLDRQLVLLVNLSKGLIGDGPSALLGAFIVAHMQKAALSRADTSKRENFIMYLDEFASYSATPALQDVLSESRKYGLSLVLAHQYLDQLPAAMLSAVMNTVGTIACFRVGYHDAARLVKDIFPTSDFLFSSETEVKLKRFGQWPYLEFKEHFDPLGWEGLAHQLSDLAPREFWVRRRGPYLPIKQRTRDLPDPVVTPELEEQLQRLLDISGARYGRLKAEVRRELAQERTEFAPDPSSRRRSRMEHQDEEEPGDPPWWGQ